MFCKYCGNKIDDDALFCSKCGRRLMAEKTAMPAESAPTEQTQPLLQGGANSEKATIDSVQMEAISEATDTAQSDSSASTAQENVAQTEAAVQENETHTDGDAEKQPLLEESANPESENALNAGNATLSAETESVATQTESPNTAGKDNALAVSPKSRAVAVMLALFGGFLGIHDFYAGRVKRGIYQLLVFPFVFGVTFGVDYLFLGGVYER